MMSTKTRYIFERYPEKKNQIWQRMLRNAEFRNICTDYGKCIEAAEYWNQFKSPDARAKVEEYRYLCDALEKEFLQVLSDSAGKQDNAR